MPSITKPSAKTWFERADQFQFTAMQLLGQGGALAAVVSYPHIVLKAFAAEAYLKSLICIEDRVPRQVHNLLQLFDQLSLDSTKTIRSRWDLESRPSLLKLKKTKPNGLNVPTSLRGALAQSGDAFLEWRYHEKGSPVAFTIMAFPLFVRARILELEPSWTPAEPNPLAWLNGANG